MQPAANVPTVNASTIAAAANTSAQGTAAARARADNDNDKDSESEGDGAEEVRAFSFCTYVHITSHSVSLCYFYISKGPFFNFLAISLFSMQKTGSFFDAYVIVARKLSFLLRVP